jgi:phosphoserine phosphatase
MGRGHPHGHRQPVVTAEPMVSPGWVLVTVDIDGTLTTVHGWRVIADALGRGAEFDRTQRRFFDREIGEDEHLADMLAIAEGHTVAEVDAALEATPHLRRIAEGIRLFHDRGSRVALLSHNPAYVCDWYCRKFGFDDSEATAGAQHVVHGVIGPPENVRADKPAGLRALITRARTTPEHVVHIGDGWADAELFPLLGGGVALNSSLPEVERAADLVLRTDDFEEVASAVEALPQRR